MCISNYSLLLNRSNRQRCRRREAECIETKVSKEALGGEKLQPSKEFLRALKKEKRRLENEVSKIDLQSPDAYKQVNKLAAIYSEYFDKHHEPMMAIEFKNFIMSVYSKNKNVNLNDKEIHDKFRKILQDVLDRP